MVRRHFKSWSAGVAKFAAACEGPLTQIKKQRHLREEIRTYKPGHVIYEDEWRLLVLGLALAIIAVYQGTMVPDEIVDARDEQVQDSVTLTGTVQWQSGACATSLRRPHPRFGCVPYLPPAALRCCPKLRAIAQGVETTVSRNSVASSC